MAAKTIVITGHKETDRALREYTPKVQKAIERKAVRRAAKPVADCAKKYAPVKTGALRDSIKVKALKRSRKNKGRVGVRVVTSDSDNLFQGKQYYGGFLEFGTAYIEPRPFLGRARDEMRPTVARIYHEELRRIVVETAHEVRPRKATKVSKAALMAAGAIA